MCTHIIEITLSRQYVPGYVPTVLGPLVGIRELSTGEIAALHYTKTPVSRYDEGCQCLGLSSYQSSYNIPPPTAPASSQFSAITRQSPGSSNTPSLQSCQPCKDGGLSCFSSPNEPRRSVRLGQKTHWPCESCFQRSRGAFDPSFHVSQCTGAPSSGYANNGMSSYSASGIPQGEPRIPTNGSRYPDCHRRRDWK